tara:strand:+ start:11535 stop:12584 length:1050 start_codon:yes stop_codon:yes gene_type:complete
MSQVNGYSVPDASGQVVRLDIEATLKAIATCNSFSSDTALDSYAEKFMLFGNTSSNKLHIHDGTSFREVGDITQDNLGLLLKSGGTLTGALLADDSATHTAPAISFDGNSDTGFYRDAANTIGISTAGVERIIIDEHGITLRSQEDIRFGDADSSNYVALQSPATVSSNVTFSLPAADGNDGDVLKTNGSGALSFGAIQGVPTGSVFCMATSTVPAGYLECDGSEHEKDGTYNALFLVIGTTWGENGTKFKLPDLRGEFVRGWDHGKGTDSGRAVGSGGHQSDQNKSHNHDFFPSSSSGQPAGWGGDNASFAGDTGTESSVHDVAGKIATSGGTETRPRNFAMMYVIKT